MRIFQTLFFGTNGILNGRRLFFSLFLQGRYSDHMCVNGNGSMVTPTKPKQMESFSITDHETADNEESLPEDCTTDETAEVQDMNQLLSHICALEVQNLKIQKSLGNIDRDSLISRASALERQNRRLLEQLSTEKPDIAIHPQKPAGEYGYINIDFSSDMGLELECFGLSEIQALSTKYATSRPTSMSLELASPGGSTVENGGHMPMPRSSRKSDTTRFSLANRLSLDWGDKNGVRPHSLQLPSVDVYKGPVRQSIDVAINSMRLSINQPLVETDVKCNFLEFCIVGVKRDILTGKALPSFGKYQDTQILENYPHDKPPLIESIADFAFPKKALLHMTDSLREAEIICERNRDKYNVFQFSDSFGTPTYACCLVVTEATPLHVKRHAKTIKGLAYMEFLERCVSIIKRFFRYAISNDIVIRRQVITNNEGKVVGYITTAVKLADVGKEVGGHVAREKEAVRAGKLGTKLSKLKDNVKSRLRKDKDASGMDTSPGLAERKQWISNKLHSRSKQKAEECLGGVFEDTNPDDPDDDEDAADAPSASNRGYKLAKPATGSDKAKAAASARQGAVRTSPVVLPRNSSPAHASITKDTTKLTSISQESTPHKKPITKPSTISGGAGPKKKHGYHPPEWKYAITQRAYCILSAKPMHAFLFQILEEIAARERKQCGTIHVNPPEGENADMELPEHGVKTRSRSLSRNLAVVLEADGEEDGADSPTAVDCTSRTLQALTRIDLSGSDDGVGGGSYTTKHREKRNKFLYYVQSHPLTPGLVGSDIVLSFSEYISHKLYIPPVMITMEEWSTAVLLSLISPSTILRLLNVLILEKSLIVHGENVSMVTAVTIGIMGFLRPFQWQGVFIPLVPPNAMEILGAPVPFIVGTCCEFSKMEMSPNATVLNLDSLFNLTRGPLLEMPDISVLMPLDQELRTTIGIATKILSERLPEKDVEHIQISTFLMDLTGEEKGAIRDVLTAVEQHNSLFCGDLVVADSWRRYGTYNPTTGDFEFYQQWFLDHQRSVLEFQDVVVHTQLFVSYVDKLRTEYVEKSSYRIFISDWIYFRHILKKKRRLQEKQCRIVRRRHS